MRLTYRGDDADLPDTDISIEHGVVTLKGERPREPVGSGLDDWLWVTVIIRVLTAGDCRMSGGLVCRIIDHLQDV